MRRRAPHCVIGRLTTFVLMACLAAACASPARRVHEFATLNGFERAEVRGNEFAHVIYRRAAQGDAARVHVYVEHDGLEQRPEYAPMRFAGHESGDFLFVPRN